MTSIAARKPKPITYTPNNKNPLAEIVKPQLHTIVSHRIAANAPNTERAGTIFVPTGVALNIAAAA